MLARIGQVTARHPLGQREHESHLCVAPALDVMQDHDFALRRGKHRQRREEPVSKVPSLGDDVGSIGSLAGLLARIVEGSGRTNLLPLAPVDGLVSSDPQEPRSEPCWVRTLAKPFVRTKKCHLTHILRVGLVPRVRARHRECGAEVAPQEHLVCNVIAGACALDEHGILYGVAGVRITVSHWPS